jgi:hypothetical protein
VQSSNGVPIVAGRVVSISAERGEAPEGVTPRPALTRGTAIGTGTPAAAPLWAVTGMPVGRARDTQIAVHNPGTGIAVVTVTVLGGSGDGSVLADAVEIQPGDSIVVQTSQVELESGTVTALVESGSPVVVERTISFANQDDLAMGLAVPLSGGADTLTDLAD